MAIPTSTDKIILVDFSLPETNVFSLRDLETNQQFSTTDKGTAFIGFKSEGLEGSTATLSMLNLDDDSKVNRVNVVVAGENFDVATNTYFYQLADDEILHGGKWIGHITFTLGVKTWTGRNFTFMIDGHIFDLSEVKLLVMDDINTFMDSIAVLKQAFSDFYTLAQDNETLRVQTVNDAETLRVQTVVDAETLRVQTVVDAENAREIKYQTLVDGYAQTLNNLLDVQWYNVALSIALS